MSEKIIAYKGFDADLKCRGFQFEVGQTYTHNGKVAACRSGFHACENPFDVWCYSPVVQDDGALTRFAEVELSGDMSREGDKIAAAQITIKAELRLPDFVRRAVDAVIAATKGEDDTKQIGSSGNYAQIGSSGNYARIGSSGGDARIGSSGDCAQIGSSGGDARIGSSGYGAQIGSSGGDARIGSSGNYARIGSSGNYARIGSSGDGAQIGSSGNYARIGSSGGDARINSEGQDAVIAGAGRDARVKGKAGTWVSLASYGNDGKCNGFGTGCIGQDGLEPDTWYRAEAGRLVKA